MPDADYADYLALLVNSLAQPETLLYSLEQAAGSNVFVNVNKTEIMSFKERVAISTLSSRPLKFGDLFKYLSSKILSTETNDNICLAKALTATDRK